MDECSICRSVDSVLVCCGEEGGKALHLPVNPCSYPYKNKIAYTSGYLTGLGVQSYFGWFLLMGKGDC